MKHALFCGICLDRITQRPSDTLEFIDNRKWVLPRNGFLYNDDPKLQAYEKGLDPRGDLSAQNSPATQPSGAFFKHNDSFHLPVAWQHHEIDISKLRFGHSEVDYGRYNRSAFVGMENVLPDAYINNIVQLLYHLPSVRQALLRHVCGRTGCLACELGFLFDMLDQAKTLPPKQRSVQVRPICVLRVLL